MYPVLGLILFDFKKLAAAEALIPKLIPSVTSLLIPETAIATNCPFSLTIGPPLFPGLIAISTVISFELFSKPFKALILPSLIFKSSLKPSPKGYPAMVIGCRFLGSSFENDIYALGITFVFNRARSKILPVEINLVSYSLLKYLYEMSL